MATENTKTYVLSEDEKTQYRGLLRRAFAAAHSFRGAETQFASIMNELIAFEDFVRIRNGGAKNDTLQAAFSQQVGEPETLTIPDLLDIMSGRRLFNQAANPEDLDAQITILQKGGAHIVRTQAVFVQTDEGSLEPSTGQTHTPYEVKFQPRLQILTEALQAFGIFFDDLIVHVGQVDKNMLREAPYIVIDIPRLGRQIALNNQVGNITFISEEILDPRVYEQLTKSQLKTLPSMHTLIYSDHWAEDAAVLLRGAEPANGRKRNLAAEAQIRRGFPLTVDLIVHSAQAHFDTTEKWPTQLSGEILYGPLEGRTWLGIDSAIKRRLRGLADARLPDTVKSIPSLLEWQGLTISRESLSNRLTVAEILESARLHFAATGERPTQNSGEILDGPLKGNIWRTIDKAIHKRNRGLADAKLPDTVKGLASLLEPSGLTVAICSPNRHLTVEAIQQSAQAHFNANNQWPTVCSGEIVHGTLTGEKWSNIDGAITARGRGLADANLPDHVKGLASLLEWKGLKISNTSPTKKLTVEAIIQSAQAHFDATGQWPKQSYGEILYGPLKGERWDNITVIIRIRGRGLHDLPVTVKSIGNLIKWGLETGLLAQPTAPALALETLEA